MTRSVEITNFVPFTQSPFYYALKAKTAFWHPENPLLWIFMKPLIYIEYEKLAIYKHYYSGEYIYLIIIHWTKQ
jgi:hypothetical protein